MISRTEAEAAAAAWARAETLTRGQQWRASVEEFDQGFIVRTIADGPADPGTGVTVIDRETGRVSTWPAWPSETLKQQYEQRRPEVVGPPKTADPEIQLRREIHRRAAPSIAAHATVDGRVYIARGAKGDQKLNHHRLVLERLAEQSPQETVRGCDRHAELIACSDALHDVDRRRHMAGQAPLTLDDARQLLRASQFQTFQIHAPGDPLAGKPNDPCETCTYVLTQLRLMPWGKTGALHHFVAPSRPNPDPARFSDTLASEMLNGGWLPDVPNEYDTEMIETLVESDVLPVHGQEHQHEWFPAAGEAYGHTNLLVLSRRAPGLEQRSRMVHVNPVDAAHTADLLHEFGRVIGARLFPLGRVNDESVLAIDEHGRVFDLDQAGEWFVADTYIEALETLVLGKRTYRVRDDGTWGPSA
ncbi:SUKH-3 domain-containing protein [Actinoplanes hulinensis]|uniref:SUKH-3 domain-containing protein n=1 Tax=Actinoplanes hulinensis TaxID=1144547 RepID=A0ABS7BEM6_9ACTN|nr:SUKH-3 domain-containing protein [Actinoplanes hulinensis]MBW6439326.1 SUKH-3 domain-containing protein [Actinoplanes hulinensis]